MKVHLDLSENRSVSSSQRISSRVRSGQFWAMQSMNFNSLKYFNNSFPKNLVNVDFCRDLRWEEANY
jgi:hypothetical protein